MPRSKLVSLKLKNFGCIGDEGADIALDNIVCLVGRNNCGKSTILRAYECAQGSKPLSGDDIYKHRQDGHLTEVELLVYIPEGTYNIDPKWKYTDPQYGPMLVKSRWQWAMAGEKPIRQTWDPETNDWSSEEKAGGADNVFNSRLPQPLRIDSLQDAHDEHEALLRLITEPVASELKMLQVDSQSALHQAIGKVVSEAIAPVERYQADIDDASDQLNRGFKGIFPELEIAINVGMDRPAIDAAKLLASGSSVRIKEGDSESFLRQQGTGSRRALFWSLLQVRNQLQRKRKQAEDRKKELFKAEGDLQKENTKKKPSLEKIAELKEKIETLQNPAAEETGGLPGHILLIDEPENALHPMAIRAARQHLYALSKDAGWQVMLTTHSPYFIDPLEDHTTIVRLERVNGKTSPKTYRADKITFSPNEKEDLRALLQLDTALAEMFFGSYPIIVEGETEVAAFIAAISEAADPLAQQVCLIPSRGKGLIEPLIKLITHFGIHFGVLHDVDTPKRKDGKNNGMWTLNTKIEAAIQDAKKKGLVVRHRLSLMNIEYTLGIHDTDKEKPLLAYKAVKHDNDLKEQVKALFNDLYQSEQHAPELAEGGSYEEQLTQHVLSWAAKHYPNDERFKVA